MERGKGGLGARETNRERDDGARICAFTVEKERQGEENSVKLLHGTYLTNEA